MSTNNNELVRYDSGDPVVMESADEVMEHCDMELLAFQIDTIGSLVDPGSFLTQDVQEAIAGALILLSRLHCVCTRSSNERSA